jgi:hypothetical protein
VKLTNGAGSGHECAVNRVVAKGPKNSTHLSIGVPCNAGSGYSHLARFIERQNEFNSRSRCKVQQHQDRSVFASAGPTSFEETAIST